MTVSNSDHCQNMLQVFNCAMLLLYSVGISYGPTFCVCLCVTSDCCIKTDAWIWAGFSHTSL